MPLEIKTMAIIEQQIEPLHPGDYLCRDEFLRRWEAMPSLRKAELIGGIVYMPISSPD
jgi:hypothetical protein